MERFWSKVQVSDGCWLWTASIFSQTGYGAFWLNGSMTAAHLVSWALSGGDPVPKGWDVDHLCHTLDLSCPGSATCPHRPCVRPDHLEPVPHRENVLRGRAAETHRARLTARTHCQAGHEYTPENTRLVTRGHRQYRDCRTCRREWNRQGKIRAREAAA